MLDALFNPPSTAAQDALEQFKNRPSIERTRAEPKDKGLKYKLAQSGPRNLAPLPPLPKPIVPIFEDPIFIEMLNLGKDGLEKLENGILKKIEKELDKKDPKRIERLWNKLSKELQKAETHYDIRVRFHPNWKDELYIQYKTRCISIYILLLDALGIKGTEVAATLIDKIAKEKIKSMEQWFRDLKESADLAKDNESERRRELMKMYH